MMDVRRFNALCEASEARLKIISHRLKALDRGKGDVQNLVALLQQAVVDIHELKEKGACKSESHGQDHVIQSQGPGVKL